MEFSTALRPFTLRRLEAVRRADILIGIPCYNNQATIQNVIEMVSQGLHAHYRDAKAVIFISDGGSTDDTRDIAKEIEIMPWQEKIIQIYRGVSGKGSAFRAIFEAAVQLDVKACMVVDSDLRSISPEWVHLLLEPALSGEYEFVAPIYTRHKYDGTITNNIVYNLTRAVYGKRIRQPIGGDFTFSRDLAAFFLDKPVWSTDIAKFGIDIWMTINAIARNVKICQSNLGVKIHDAKDPAQSLGPMFVQVVGTLFNLMEHYEPFWKNVTGSRAVPLFGSSDQTEPEAVAINMEKLVHEYRVGFSQFQTLYKAIFSPEVYRVLEEASGLSVDAFAYPVEIWVKALYELASTYHYWKVNRVRLINLMVPLYYGRVAQFVNETRLMNSLEAEGVVERQAQIFEDHKDYLMRKWNEERAEPEMLHAPVH
ncbi:MAG: glycosyltransferase [Spirochaetes bacterium]|nr:MAG: glycosyltransferase [Spirochaetota bacterium]